MADDYEAATAGLGGGPGIGAAGSGLRKREGSYDERLQDMRRHLRAQQDKQHRLDQRKKNREKEMAKKWVEYQAEVRQEREQELHERLEREQKSKDATSLQRQSARKTDCSESGCRHREHADRQTLASGCSAGSKEGIGGNGHHARAEAEAEPAIAGKRESLTVPSSGAPPSREDHSRVHAAASDGSVTVTHAAASTAVGTQEAAPKKGASQRMRKKKREEVTTQGGPVRPGGTQREKSIMQKAQEEFQGLCRSADGRAILDLGTKHQRKHREALVKGDPAAVEMVEQELEENGEEEPEQEVQEQPTIPHKHMARRYRLRMMSQITSQVLNCRRKMAENFQQSFLSPRGLGCSPQMEAKMPAGPTQSQWVTSEAWAS